VVGVSLEGVRIPISRRRVTDIARSVFRAERATHALVSVAFVTNRAIRTLNRAHLRRRGETDVIAFAYRQPGRRSPLVGDVYIAPDVARAFARSNGIGVREEITRLVVHGVLHVLGHDHGDGAARMRGAMWQRQERLVRRLVPRR
jgi:probable rRNA maturation factor